MVSRDHIPLKTKLAAALIQVGEIPHEHAKLMTADQIISLFDLHHWPIPAAAGGPDAPWNLEFHYRTPHRERTAKVDIPRLAKDRRISAAQKELQRILTKPAGHRRKRKGRWPRGRKILNRRRRQR